MLKISAILVTALLSLSAHAGVGAYVCQLSNLTLSGKSNAFVLSQTKMEGVGTINCIQDLDAEGTYITANGISTPVKVVLHAIGIGPIIAHYHSEDVRLFSTGIGVGSNPNNVFGTYYGGRISASLVQPQGGINLAFSKDSNTVGFNASLYFGMITDGVALGAALQGTDLTIIPLRPGETWQPISAN